jgi:hypothetical protein
MTAALPRLDPAEMPVADLLHRLSLEMGELSVMAETLQDLPARLGPLDPNTIVLAQAIDLLSQRLDGLAAFSAAIAGTVPAGWHVDAQPAAALVKLSDLQHRLTHCRLMGLVTEEAHDPDEMELF